MELNPETLGLWGDCADRYQQNLSQISAGHGA